MRENESIHPAVEYVNSTNKDLYASVDEVVANGFFLVVEDSDGSKGFCFGTVDKNTLSQLNSDKKFYYRDDLSSIEIHDAIMELSGDVELEDIISDDFIKLKDTKDAFLAGCIMYFLKFDKIALRIIKNALVNEKLRLGQLHFAYNSNIVIERYKQHLKSSRPRNANHDVALKIIENTWKRYPGASKAGMCSKLYQHFKGTVSKDSIGRWIRKSKLQPPKPDKYTAFSLVID